jgi:hypothetical protein
MRTSSEHRRQRCAIIRAPDNLELSWRRDDDVESATTEPPWEWVDTHANVE